MMLYYKAIIKAAPYIYRMIARNRFFFNYANGRFSHSGSHMGIIGNKKKKKIMQEKFLIKQYWVGTHGGESFWRK